MLRLKDLNPNSYSNQPKEPKKKVVSKHSEKMIQQKFLRELDEKLLDILEEEELPQNLNSYAFTQLVVDLGFVR